MPIAHTFTPKSKVELQELIKDDSVYLGDIDTSAVTDMSFLFENSNRKDFSGISSWDVSKVENINFIETLQLLAERANITLPALESSEDNKTLELKARLYKINELTARFLS